MTVRVSDREARGNPGEAGERQIDRFIELRSRQFGSEEASEFARQRAQAERDEEQDKAALRRVLWRRHYARLARVHAALAEQNRRKAESLMDATRPSTNGGHA